jgi:phage shock protein A
LEQRIEGMEEQATELKSPRANLEKKSSELKQKSADMKSLKRSIAVYKEGRTQAIHQTSITLAHPLGTSMQDEDHWIALSEKLIFALNLEFGVNDSYMPQ